MHAASYYLPKRETSNTTKQDMGTCVCFVHACPQVPSRPTNAGMIFLALRMGQSQVDKLQEFRCRTLPVDLSLICMQH